MRLFGGTGFFCFKYKMAFIWILLSILFLSINAAEIELLECEPPDIPVWGGYGPQQSYYIPGDVIHYYCDVDTFIGGNFYRKCLDTGDWIGDTPVCDAPTTFISSYQSSDADDQGIAENAVDGIRSTCSETIGMEKEEWYGNFSKPGQLIRVMLFLPKGPASYEVVLIKENGDEVVCGSQTANIDRYDWTFHNCPEPNNVGAAGLKIRSLSNDALKICEIAAFVLTSPKCMDPHVHIERGRLRLNRKTATLVCDKGFTRSPDAKLECIREGVWNRKTLYCLERQWELDDRAPDTNNDENPNREPNQDNPDRERLEN